MGARGGPDRFRERVRQSSKPGNWWKPTEGEILTGTLLKTTTVQGSHGEQAIYLIQNDEDGETVTVSAYAVLRSEFERQQIVDGMRVGIKYLGEKKNYKDFVVMVDAEQDQDDGTNDEGPV